MGPAVALISMPNESQRDVTKEIGWSYPSSPNAVRFGFGKSGCWTVSTTRGQKPPVALSGHAERSEALTAALKLPYDWAPLFARHNPDVLESGAARASAPVVAPLPESTAAEQAPGARRTAR